ncbi:MAG: hypothetical protein KBT48_01385 [Firmicutes bacterium]|nr:hypothetical protein [Bacillota bacterium]
MNKEVMGAIIGLVKTSQNNPKTENTDSLLVQALSDCDNEKWIEILHQEKYLVSPGCKTCASPCGNTDDYVFKKEEEEVDSIKKFLLNFCIQNAKNADAYTLINQCLCFVGYDLEAKYYSQLVTQVKSFLAEKK